MAEPYTPCNSTATPQITTPVVLFVFNRPEYTKQVWAAIRAARPGTLLIVADGPRRDRADEAARCAEVRRIVTAELDWPCDRRTHFSAENLGCRGRIASGLRWVFGQVEEAIILEDDCLPEPSFFPFCQELLVRYRNDEHIGMIAGTNYQSTAPTPDGDSYFASRHFSIWGWATWRRAVAGYDERMPSWRTATSASTVSRFFPDRATRLLYRTMFDLAREQGVDSWDIAWCHHLLSRGQLSLVAAHNLITNIGVEGTRGRTGDPNQFRLTTPMPLPLRHPPSLECRPQYDRLVTSRHRIVRDWMRALWLLRVRRLFGRR